MHRSQSLSARQKHILEYERIHGPEDFRALDAFLCHGVAGPVDQGACERLVKSHHGQSQHACDCAACQTNRDAVKPLPPSILKRIAALDAPEAARRRALNRRAERVLKDSDRVLATAKNDAIRDRIRKLDAFDVPRIVDRPSFDQLVARQIEAQPAQYRAALNSLYASWAMHNELYFAGRLRLPIISIKKLEGSLADCGGCEGATTIRINSSTLRDYTSSQRSDVLLHEMIHQCIQERDGRSASFGSFRYCGHTEEFARIANNIARMRGWPDCSEKTTRGRTAAKYWPPRTQ